MCVPQDSVVPPPSPWGKGGWGGLGEKGRRIGGKYPYGVLKGVRGRVNEVVFCCVCLYQIKCCMGGVIRTIMQRVSLETREEDFQKIFFG